MPIIEVENLVRTFRVYQKRAGLFGALRGLFRREYKEVRAVSGVSFRVEPGEMVAFLGPNGAGKTTTLKILSGLIHPTQGTARVLGFTPWERKNEFRRRFSLVLGQKNQLWWDLPAADSFRLHRAIYALDRKEFAYTLEELTELFGVARLTRQPVRELSLGERMKMELIAALLHRPQLLLLDEPTIGLDVVAQAAIRRCLREYNERRGVTVVLTSHYMRDVEALCRRAILISQGELVYDGSLAGIAGRFGRTKVVRMRFVGPPPGGLEEFGEVTRREGSEVELRIARERVPTILGSVLATHPVADMSVEEPPLEVIIASVFEKGWDGNGGDHDPT